MGKKFAQKEKAALQNGTKMVMYVVHMYVCISPFHTYMYVGTWLYTLSNRQPWPRSAFSTVVTKTLVCSKSYSAVPVQPAIAAACQEKSRQANCP